ncbi:MAG: hypothetical protein FJY07_01295, partial [Bacteroidetes bacterium]|nr:hypothetical protein [Bacteroidota bacterium]
MHRSLIFAYILIVIYMMETITGFSQVDPILKPVEIHPPVPGIQKPKQETDEQLAAQYFQKKDFEKALIFYEKLFKKNKNSINYNYYLF